MNQMIRYSYAIALIVLCAAYRSDAQSDVTLVDKDISVYGFNMRYGEAGQGDPIVLLHGLWGGRNEWTHAIGPLAQTNRVIAVDLIGFHGSEKPEATYHNALLAQFLVGFLDQLALENVTLMGHAMGGNTACNGAIGLGRVP